MREEYKTPLRLEPPTKKGRCRMVATPFKALYLFFGWPFSTELVPCSIK